MWVGAAGITLDGVFKRVRTRAGVSMRGIRSPEIKARRSHVPMHSGVLCEKLRRDEKRGSGGRVRMGCERPKL